MLADDDAGGFRSPRSTGAERSSPSLRAGPAGNDRGPQAPDRGPHGPEPANGSSGVGRPTGPAGPAPGPGKNVARWRAVAACTIAGRPYGHRTGEPCAECPSAEACLWHGVLQDRSGPPTAPGYFGGLNACQRARLAEGLSAGECRRRFLGEVTWVLRREKGVGTGRGPTGGDRG
jgi:hypothetical protein